MKVYKGVEVEIHSFSTFTLERGGHLYTPTGLPVEKEPIVGATVDLKVLGEMKKFAHCSWRR